MNVTYRWTHVVPVYSVGRPKMWGGTLCFSHIGDRNGATCSFNVTQKWNNQHHIYVRDSLLMLITAVSTLRCVEVVHSDLRTRYCVIDFRNMRETSRNVRDECLVVSNAHQFNRYHTLSTVTQNPMHEVACLTHLLLQTPVSDTECTCNTVVLSF